MGIKILYAEYEFVFFLSQIAIFTCLNVESMVNYKSHLSQLSGRYVTLNVPFACLTRYCWIGNSHMLVWTLALPHVLVPPELVVFH